MRPRCPYSRRTIARPAPTWTHCRPFPMRLAGDARTLGLPPGEMCPSDHISAGPVRVTPSRRTGPRGYSFPLVYALSLAGFGERCPRPSDAPRNASGASLLCRPGASRQVWRPAPSLRPAGGAGAALATVPRSAGGGWGLGLVRRDRRGLPFADAPRPGNAPAWTLPADAPPCALVVRQGQPCPVPG